MTQDPLGRLTAALADRYRVERELGQGGMATVYLAEDLRHKRKVAVKVLRPELAAVLGADRFVQEITTTAALQHPHILPLFDSGEADGFLYYVMPYVEGETLRDKLDRETQLGVDEAVRLTREIADALDYAHRHGVIHRDIKPENILLHDGRPMVADFGIALALSAAAGGRMTETGMSLGTPHYMSPEQATAEKEITARSDVYSLGTVLYEMLAGQPPHLGGSAQQIIMKIITEDAPPVTTLRKSVPPNVAAAVAKSLEKLPADRFESAADFAAALGNAAFTTISAKSGVAPAAPPASRTAVLAATALLAVLAALWGWVRPVHSAAGGQPWRVRIVLPDTAQLHGSFALSSDGSFLVYEGANGLWKRAADAPDPVRVAGTDANYIFPSLSPDGRQVALVGQGGIVILPLSGGTPRVAFAQPFGTVVGWTDNGHIVVPVRGGLVRVSTAGGATQRFMTLDTAAGDLFPVEVSGLPNGGAVFSIVGTDTTNIAVVGPDGGKPTRLLSGLRAAFAPPGYLIVTRADGAIVAVPFDPGRRRITGAPVSLVAGLRTGAFTTVGSVAVSATGRLLYVAAGGAFADPRDLVWVGRSGAVAPAAPGWAGLFMSVALSPDGRRAAVDEFRESDEVLSVRDLSSGSVARVAIPLMQLNDPVFSPDGRWLYFAAQGVFRADPGGLSPPEPVIAPVSPQPALAADGRQLFYTKAVAGGTQLVRHALPGGTADAAVTPAGASSGSPRTPQVSPDGRWLAFLVTVSGRAEVHVRSTDPARSEEWPLATTDDGETSLRWAPAGDELFFVAHDSMMAVRVTTVPTFAGGTPRALFATAGRIEKFEVARDGRFLMIRSRPDLRPPTELVMLERWTDLLPR